MKDGRAAFDLMALIAVTAVVLFVVMFLISPLMVGEWTLVEGKSPTTACARLDGLSVKMVARSGDSPFVFKVRNVGDKPVDAYALISSDLTARQNGWPVKVEDFRLMSERGETLRPGQADTVSFAADLSHDAPVSVHVAGSGGCAIDAVLHVHTGGDLMRWPMRAALLAYFAQIRTLRLTGHPLYDNRILAAPNGPMVRDVEGLDPAMVLAAAGSYGQCTMFDLSRLSRRDGGAWRATFTPGTMRVITPAVLLASTDKATPPRHTLADGIRHVEASWPNALAMLADS